MAGTRMVTTEQKKNTQRLGVAGLALHYANVINQIDNIVSSVILLLCLIFHFMHGDLPNWKLSLTWKQYIIRHLDQPPFRQIQGTHYTKDCQTVLRQPYDHDYRL